MGNVCKSDASAKVEESAASQSAPEAAPSGTKLHDGIGTAQLQAPGQRRRSVCVREGGREREREGERERERERESENETKKHRVIQAVRKQRARRCVHCTDRCQSALRRTLS